MHNKILFLFVFVVIVGTTIYSQQKEATISFKEEIYDFGKIKEDDGKATHRFEFTNTGLMPLVLYKVEATCGCTTPKYSSEPIQPGKAGFIDVTFNPQRRPGNFNKPITVSSNSSNGLVVLRVKGFVIEKEKSVNDLYPFVNGNIRLEKSNFGFGKINHDEKKTMSFKFINVSDTMVTISFRNLPKHLTINSIPETLGSGEQGKLVVTFDATLKNDWDYVLDRIYPLQNGKSVQNKGINVVATIVEDFSKMTALDSANAPSMSFEQTNYNFGVVKPGTKVTHDFVFTNTGKSDLIIRKVKASCGCTAVKPSDSVIPPGGTSHVKAIFDTKGRKNKQTKTVNIITNDPKNYKIVLRLEGLVQGVQQ